MACVSVAGPQQNYREIVLGTNTSGTSAMNVNGIVDAVYVAVSDGASTGTVTLAYAPLVGGTSINISTNAVTDEKVWRPVVDRTDTAGAALTSDEPAPYVLAGEAVTFSVSGSPTGLTWRCVVVTK
jgi:hypothetical protein